MAEQSGIATGDGRTSSVVGSTAAVGGIELEPALRGDLPEALDRLLPPSRSYGHEQAWHDGNGHSHLQATLLGPVDERARIRRQARARDLAADLPPGMRREAAAAHRRGHGDGGLTQPMMPASPMTAASSSRPPDGVGPAVAVTGTVGQRRRRGLLPLVSSAVAAPAAFPAAMSNTKSPTTSSSPTGTPSASRRGKHAVGVRLGPAAALPGEDDLEIRLRQRREVRQGREHGCPGVPREDPHADPPAPQQRDRSPPRRRWAPRRAPRPSRNPSRIAPLAAALLLGGKRIDVLEDQRSRRAVQRARAARGNPAHRDG